MNNPIRKKLIEVALPLEAINEASVREGFIYKGNPSAIHKWWAQRPLAAARAIIFAQMVDDPSSWPDLFPTERAQRKERNRLFEIIEELVLWENTNSEVSLAKARAEIEASWRRTCTDFIDHPDAKSLFQRNRLPGFHDPFSGGATLPLEAQRLGLNTTAADLNPVSVLISKALLELPVQVAGKAPVAPELQNAKDLGTWTGTLGLAADLKAYGAQLVAKIEEQLANLYPSVQISAEMLFQREDLRPLLGKAAKPIAWIWARTVKSPNPAFRDIDVPLVSTFILSSKAGKERWLEPIIEGRTMRFAIRTGKPPSPSVAAGTKMGRGANFSCLMSGVPISGDYVKDEGRAGRMGYMLLAIVADGGSGRIYLPASAQPTNPFDTRFAPSWRPEVPLPDRALGFSAQLYFNEGSFSDLYLPRQLHALTTMVEMVKPIRNQILKDLEGSSEHDSSYADAICTYLSFAIDKTAEYSCTLVPWYTKEDRPKGLFSKQAIPLVWDFAETNPLSTIGGSLIASIRIIADALVGCSQRPTPARAFQQSAAKMQLDEPRVVSTDPPYFDNIGYGHLSDFFYSWLRSSLREIYPGLLATVSVPKAEELIAEPNRHGGREAAEAFFLKGMSEFMESLRSNCHPAYPITIYYAFRQSESEGTSVVSTGWETFLQAIVDTNYIISGTWPLRTERQSRSRDISSNALASSIVLVCRKREELAGSATRRDFLTALQKELAVAVAELQRGNVAPVDLQQAAIGPGMAIFTRYSKVIDASGEPLAVREALALINQALDEVLAHQEGDFDADTRWALAWFEQFGFAEGDYGVAETLSKAKNTSVDGIRQAGIGTHGKGKVRLFKPEELPSDWSPESDNRLTVWDMVHHLIRTLEQGEEAAGRLLAKLGAQADTAKDLAYRLYSICERKKRSTDGQRYNGLVSSWPELLRLAQQTPQQEQLPQQSFEGMN